MISKYSHKELTWIDLESPLEEELVYIIEEYYIPSSIEEEMRAKTEETKTKLYSDFIFTSLYFPQILHGENKIINDKIVFVTNDNFVLTIHDRPIQALHEFLNNLEIDTTIEEKLEIKNNKLLFAYLLKSLYVNLQEQLVANDIQIRGLKKQIIKNNKKLKLLTLLSIIFLVAIILIFICL